MNNSKRLEEELENARELAKLSEDVLSRIREDNEMMMEVIVGIQEICMSKAEQDFSLKTTKLAEQAIFNLEGLNESKKPKIKKPKIWELLINWLPCDDRKDAVIDLKDLVEDKKSSGASKIEIFFFVLLNLLPVLPRLIFGQFPIPSKKRNE